LENLSSCEVRVKTYFNNLSRSAITARATVPFTTNATLVEEQTVLELEKAPVIWMTGLSGAGKTTLCRAVAKQLHTDCRNAVILDGDVLRKGLCSDLGFSAEDRIESVRRIAHVAKLFASTGTIVLVAVMAPIEAARRIARSIVPDMIQVFVDASLESCELRDVKGLYAKARSGELKEFTGIDSPFEPPPDAQVVCYSDRESIEACTDRILNILKRPAQDARIIGTDGRRRTIAVDFDGVISNYSGWQGPDVLGAPRDDVRSALHALRLDGWKIIVHTTRGLESVRSYLLREDVPFDEINRNSDYSNEGPKPVATVYWDDRALRYTGDATADLLNIRNFRTWAGRD
jgi:adenylylsulfate kinase